MSVGEKITVNADNSLNVPTHPIIPFIEGDGIGVDITPAMMRVVNAALTQAYGNARRIVWLEVLAGEKAFKRHGSWLPDTTLNAIKEHVVSIKGPLSTPVGGGIRSLNVSLRQNLDLYVCLRPVQYFAGVPSPLKHPEYCQMVIFRENTEDIYAGIEWAAKSEAVARVLEVLKELGAYQQVRFPDTVAIGIKPVSEEGSTRLVRKAIQYAIDHHRQSVTLVHKGNIMKFTEGGFKQWGYALAEREFAAKPKEGGHCLELPNGIVIKDCIADAFLQEILLHPQQHDVVATLNLNGDYISDALAAQVGGIGIAPGANLSDSIAMFEATHGTAPNLAGRNIANPCSLILSAEMMLRHLGWTDAADAVLHGVAQAILSRRVTADFASDMPDATVVSTSQFAEEIVGAM